MKASSKIKILIIVIVFLVVATVIFIFKINKPKAEFSDLVFQIQKSNEAISFLIQKNESLLSSIEEKYKQNQFKEALDLSVQIKNITQSLTDGSLKLTEQLKQIIVILPTADAQSRSIIEQAAKYEIDAMNYLLTYSAYKEILIQQIGAKYEAIVDGRNIEQEPNVLDNIKEMGNFLKLIKQNIQSAHDLIQKI